MTAQTYRAVLIANSTFPVDAFNLPDLEGPRNDPTLLRDALCDPDVGLFSPDNVRLVPERTMAEVLGETEDLLVSATRRDTLLIYYSGHGLLDQSGELFLCTRDTRSDRLRSTAVKASDLRGMMDASAAGAMVVVLDCCHSGRFKGGDIPATLSGRGRFVVTSSRPGELANDADVRNHASLFTHHLAEGIVKGAEDRDGDGIVTLSDLYDYVRHALAQEGRQVPQKRFEGDGDVALARREVAHGEHPPDDLVDPTVSVPVLDVSETAIHLGEVGSDERLPPERIAVINRGGGTLTWTVESSEPWVEPVPEGNTVVLHLRPVPGPNRANVYVRDAGGALKTIRVSVRVRDTVEPRADAAGLGRPPEPPPRPSRARPKVSPTPETSPADDEPADEQMSGARPSDEQASDERATAPGGHDRLPPWSDVRWWAAATAIFCLSMGIAVIASTVDLVHLIKDQTGNSLWLRRQHLGGGLLPEVLAGWALVVVGVVTLGLLGLRRLSPLAAKRAMAVCFALAVAWSLMLLGDTGAARNAGSSWMLEEISAPYVIGGLLTLAALVGFGMRKTGTWRVTNWAPPRLQISMFGAGLVWVASLNVDYYTLYDERYGRLFHHNATTNMWFLLAALSIVALTVAGLRALEPEVGGWLLAAAALTPVVMMFAEIMYLVDDYENPDSAMRLWVLVVPTVALVGLTAAALRLSRRPPGRLPSYQQAAVRPDGKSR